MTEFEVLTDPNYQRGCDWLRTKIDSPFDLYSLWRVFGSWRARGVPAIENRYPWWQM